MCSKRASPWGSYGRHARLAYWPPLVGQEGEAVYSWSLVSEEAISSLMDMRLVESAGQDRDGRPLYRLTQMGRISSRGSGPAYG
ncbi:hypothetical protein CHELA20_53941 [Hyphomicrobiales bacterium]|nr:hypothetical protein CHELA41_20986 [Hyphomicrobiales bacterium]CAH1685270.1 hypothetical protein CHELA20_53941 [Hyphomicrobiales bacterium]